MSVISAVGYQETNFKSKNRLRLWVTTPRQPPPLSLVAFLCFCDDADDSMVSESLVLAASSLDGQVGQMCEDRAVVV